MKWCRGFLISVMILLVPMASNSSSDPMDGLLPVVTPDGGRYRGAVVDGVRHGHGRVEWSNGAYYEGNFVDGLFEGTGRLRLGNGDIYEGTFIQGLQSGIGVSKTIAGIEYQGEFKDGLPNGQGKATYPDGSKYEGEFRNGLPHGVGKLVATSYEYDGEFQYGDMAGKGEFRHRSGRIYSGEFVQGDFGGRGKLREPNGVLYEGEFKDGALSGSGSITYANGAREEGNYVDWQLDGVGKYYDLQGNTYEGNFKQGRLVGGATVRSKNGAQYVGELNEWMPHGKGELHLANGDVYRGGFEYGMYSGEGTLTYAKPKDDGRTRDSGMWQFGRLKKEEDEQRRRTKEIAERALYGQADRLDKALRGLRPSDPKTIDMYLLVVAGDGSQEVFRREAEFVRHQFDNQFGTQGRSVTLINSRESIDGGPLATVTSIRRAISAIADVMDKENDILFLFATSHGSREAGLSLSPQGMQLPELSGSDLGVMLREAGIRWKVVVLSACHAASMFDGVRDPGTLMIAAARADRRSFGCADENDFTYFGRAYFKEALPTAKNFEDAFEKATRLVGEWEERDSAKKRTTGKAEGKPSQDDEARSLPQMEAPDPIRKHLGKWFVQRGNRNLKVVMH